MKIPASLPPQNLTTRTLFVLLTVFSGFIFPVGTACAVCPVPHLRATAEYFKRDVVFIGTVAGVRVEDDESGWFYILRVEKIFRGAKHKTIEVYTENASGRFPLEINQKYLLFASQMGDRLTIDNCGNSALASRSAISIQQLDAMPQMGKSGEIEGWVVAEADGIDVSGVRVTVRKAAKSYSAVTNKEGWFHLDVPPGRFHMDFESNQYYITGDEFFWYDPRHFVVHAGECAALQVISMRHRLPANVRQS